MLSLTGPRWAKRRQVGGGDVIPSWGILVCSISHLSQLRSFPPPAKKRLFLRWEKGTWSLSECLGVGGGAVLGAASSLACQLLVAKTKLAWTKLDCLHFPCFHSPTHTHTHFLLLMLLIFCPLTPSHQWDFFSPISSHLGNKANPEGRHLHFFHFTLY